MASDESPAGSEGMEGGYTGLSLRGVGGAAATETLAAGASSLTGAAGEAPVTNK